MCGRHIQRSLNPPRHRSLQKIQCDTDHTSMNAVHQCSQVGESSGELDYTGTVLAYRFGAMAYREFQDSSGHTWKVWDTFPTRPESMPAGWREGWLTFEGEPGRRRLAPIPKGWEEAPPSRLELMCRAAEAGGRNTPPRGTESSFGE